MLSFFPALLRKMFLFSTDNFKTLVVFYISVQFLYVLFSNVQYNSDSLYYFNLAQDCLQSSSIYPSIYHMNENYIVAPLYINILQLVLFIHNSSTAIIIFNVSLNMLQLLLVYKITQKIFDDKSAKIAGICFIFYLTSVGMILFNLTELMFMVFALASIYFFLKGKPFTFFISGIFAAASVAIRPVGWGLLAAYLLISILKVIKHKKIFQKHALTIVGFILIILIYGFINYSRSGNFIYTSTTGSVNLIIGANDFATGAYNARVFEKGNSGHIENEKEKTFQEKSKEWRSSAVKWINEHTIKWISLIPPKLAHMFLWDDFALAPLVGIYDLNLYKIFKAIQQKKFPSELFSKYSVPQKISYVFLLIIHHFYYFSLLTLIIIMYVKNFRHIVSSEAGMIIFIVILCGLLITILTFGDARYKYPYIILSMISISPFISKYLNFNTRMIVNHG